MSDPTREAVAAAISKVGPWNSNDAADAAIAAFLASPPDWLTALVVIVHDELCGASEHPTGCCNECLAVPPPVRSAAGLDTP